MLAMAGNGSAEGTWLRADRQTHGRGRLGRQWQECSGNLYCSGLVRLQPNDPAPHTLAFVAGLALYRALQSIAPDLPQSLKWPNDLLLDGAKVAGLLCEREGGAVVIGIGLNLQSAPVIEGRRTSAVSDFLHENTPAPEAFMPLLANSFETALEKWRSHPIENLFRAWQSTAHPIGTDLSVMLGDELIIGKYHGLQPDGALRLKAADGTVKIITAGDVELLSGEGE